LQEFQRQVIVHYNFRNVLDRTMTLFRLEEEKCNRRPTKRTPEVVDAVEEIIESGKNFRYLAQHVNVSIKMCRRMFKKD
jgi:hypothetical protein